MWTKTEKFTNPLQAILIGVMVLIVALAVTSKSWILYLVAILGLFAVLSSWSWALKIDSKGFSYRSLIGIPRSTIPYSEIEEVQVVDINPSSWGGWGWRINSSGTGLIVRSGQGIRIKRANGKILEASCEDAETAVALMKSHSEE